MKVFMSDKTRDKLVNMIKTMKPGFISIRKFNPAKDAPSSLLDNVKLELKYRDKHKSKQFYAYYVCKGVLRELNNRLEGVKEGGFLPALLPLLPLIFGGLAAAGSVAGGTAAVVKAVNDKRASDMQNEEQRRYHDELLARSNDGGGLESDDDECRDFITALDVDGHDRKLVKNILKGLGQIVRIQRSGSGLYLQPR